VYHTKYKQAGVHPEDIRGIKDIAKLPFISKKDLTDHYPNDILPVKYNRKHALAVSTSGSSGKPLYFYTDFSVLAATTAIAKRTLDRFNIHWRKSRYAHIGNFGINKPDAVYEDGIIANAKLFFSLKNYLSMNAFDPIKDIVKRLNEFQPDLILTYPATYRHLAYFKRQGYGEQINPKILTVGASVTDAYTRRYVEEVFGCRMANAYSSAEAGSDIAVECEQGNWHINYDFYHLEVIDDEMQVVSPGERGKVVLTRLFGQGTPILRYTGMEDWIRLGTEDECGCGLSTPIIKGGVEGRVSASIVLPDGRVFPAASFASVSKVLNELKTSKVIQFQIIQKTIDEIDILLVLDYDLKEKTPSVDTIFKKIKELHEKKAGPQVTITVKEVKASALQSTSGKPAPMVLSQVKPEKGYKVTEQ
jgi:phenylacetate-CoA ligase